VPADLRELQDWLDTKAKDEAAMPIEARLACRRGMIAWRPARRPRRSASARRDRARSSYAAPPLTLTGWFLFREPSQALQSGAEVLERVRADFRLQLELVGNMLFFAIQGLFFGLLAAALILVGRHQRELRHMWQERLGNRAVGPQRGALGVGFLLCVGPRLRHPDSHARDVRHALVALAARERAVFSGW